MTKEVKTPNPRKKLFFGLFVFPLVIAVGMALLLSLIVFLTKEEETPESLIKAIKIGAPSKRWQKAFELSNELNRKETMIREAGIMKEAIHILNDRGHYDAKTRAYIAMAISKFNDAEAKEALQNALGQIEEADGPELPIFLMWALGNFKDPASAKFIAPFTNNKQDDLRKTAAYILGVLGNPKFKPALLKLLEDPVSDVKWNAALSLARLQDDAGSKVMLEMLDRNYLRNVAHMNNAQIEPVMINALRGFSLIDKKEAAPVLESLSKGDESLKVRQAALLALEHKTKL